MLNAILRQRNASLKCLFDAFADYVEEAEHAGRDQYPLYQWTKDTIGNPEKKAKYLKSFTVYVSGEQVYDKETADGLHAKLSALVGKAGIESVTRFDANWATIPSLLCRSEVDSPQFSPAPCPRASHEGLASRRIAVQ
ncbi:hypothetical protein [Paraburkholderia hospita]|uniref:hypothetical protein n=1 Tax=Paraburkholderia hospita TaxID=169430 RepID=UPI001A98B617